MRPRFTAFIAWSGCGYEIMRAVAPCAQSCRPNAMPPHQSVNLADQLAAAEVHPHIQPVE
jgi:hypothetical protein